MIIGLNKKVDVCSWSVSVAFWQVTSNILEQSWTSVSTGTLWEYNRDKSVYLTEGILLEAADFATLSSELSHISSPSR